VFRTGNGLGGAISVYGFDMEDRSKRRCGLVALGKGVLYLDPGETRLARARVLRVWEEAASIMSRAD
jgi:hypothetical protein